MVPDKRRGHRGQAMHPCRLACLVPVGIDSGAVEHDNIGTSEDDIHEHESGVTRTGKCATRLEQYGMLCGLWKMTTVYVSSIGKLFYSFYY